MPTDRQDSPYGIYLGGRRAGRSAALRAEAEAAGAEIVEHADARPGVARPAGPTFLRFAQDTLVAPQVAYLPATAMLWEPPEGEIKLEVSPVPDWIAAYGEAMCVGALRLMGIERDAEICFEGMGS